MNYCSCDWWVININNITVVIGVEPGDCIHSMGEFDREDIGLEVTDIVINIRNLLFEMSKGIEQSMEECSRTLLV